MGDFKDLTQHGKTLLKTLYDLQDAKGDEEYKKTAETLWNNLSLRKKRVSLPKS